MQSRRQQRLAAGVTYAHTRVRERTPGKAMRRASVALTTAALVALTAAALAGADALSQLKRLETVRVCGLSALDQTAGECTRDESARPLRSSQFNCSSRATGSAGERFAGRFLYRGQAFPAYGTSVSSTRRGVFIFLTAGPNPMPGGSWGCELRIGPEVVRKSFRSAGPTGPILHLAACRASRTVPAGPVRVCRRDESGAPFSATESVTCSAVFAGGKGKLASIAFLHGRTEAFSGDFTLPLPVTAAGPRLDPRPKLAAGQWSCRWSLAGRVLGTKKFQIG